MNFRESVNTKNFFLLYIYASRPYHWIILSRIVRRVSKATRKNQLFPFWRAHVNFRVMNKAGHGTLSSYFIHCSATQKCFLENVVIPFQNGPRPPGKAPSSTLIKSRRVYIGCFF